MIVLYFTSIVDSPYLVWETPVNNDNYQMYAHINKCRYASQNVILPLRHLCSQLISPLCCIYASVNRVSIGSDNGLSPTRRQAIILTNAGLLSIGSLETNFSEFLIKIQIYHSRKCIWKYCLWNGGNLSRERWVKREGLLHNQRTAKGKTNPYIDVPFTP